MNEPLLIGAILAGALAAVLLARLGRSREHESHALARLEAKLDAILKHQGIQFDPNADIPPSVLDALRRGRKIEAIREYRAATGAGLKEAKDRIDEIWRRAAPRV